MPHKMLITSISNWFFLDFKAFQLSEILVDSQNVEIRCISNVTRFEPSSTPPEKKRGSWKLMVGRRSFPFGVLGLFAFNLSFSEGNLLLLWLSSTNLPRSTPLLRCTGSWLSSILSSLGPPTTHGQNEGFTWFTPQNIYIIWVIIFPSIYIYILYPWTPKPMKNPALKPLIYGL